MPQNVRDDDRPIVLTPITVPDPAIKERRGRIRRRVGGALALALVAAGVSWWIVVANEDHPVIGTTARYPASFGPFARAKDGDTLWQGTDGDHADRAGAELTYRAPDGRGAMISVHLDMPAPDSDDHDPFNLKGMAAHSTTPVHVTTHPAGRHGGSIRCEDITGGRGPLTYCVWTSPQKAAWTFEDEGGGTKAFVTFISFQGHDPAHSSSAPADLRAFLDGITFGRARLPDVLPSGN